MEARATLNGASVSKTFVAAVLVLVAMGLGAMGGYAVRGLGASGASNTVIGQQYHPAAGTVLRQDNPPAKAQGLVDRGADRGPQQSDTSAIRAIRGGTRGGHGDLP